MPRNKDLKRLVRARMSKTGEAYTTALSHIDKKSRSATAYKATAPSASGTIDYAAIAGMSDEKVKAKTGCTWERWIYALDRKKAENMTHGEIAKLISEKYQVEGWWSQMVTVGYERIKGRRARGQRLDGTYEASKSRTFNVPVKTLFDTWSDAGVRRRWLNAAGVKVRTATSPKSMRLGWSDGTIVAVSFEAKGKSKSTVSLAHTRLADREASDRSKKSWTDRLDALGALLSEEGRKT